jgi:hypothetical protein
LDQADGFFEPRKKSTGLEHCLPLLGWGGSNDVRSQAPRFETYLGDMIRNATGRYAPGSNNATLAVHIRDVAGRLLHIAEISFDAHETPF